MEFTEEQIQLVQKVSVWCQGESRFAEPRNPVLDKILDRLFTQARGNGMGWRGIAKEDKHVFAEALSYCIPYEKNLEEEPC